MIMPLLILLVLGIVELGWKLAQFNDVRHTVREGARLLAVDSAADIEQRVCDTLDLVGGGITAVRISWDTDPDGNGNTDIGEPGSIRVEVDVSSLSGAPLISVFLPSQLGSDVQFRLEQTPSQWSDRLLSPATLC